MCVVSGVLLTLRVISCRTMFMCLKILFVFFFADNKPVQVMMTLKNTRYLLCTLHRKRMWQVPLDLIFEKGTIVTLSCNGAGYVHLIGYFKNKILEEPKQDWIKTLSKHLLNSNVKELKSGGKSFQELSNYLKTNEEIEIDGDWIVKSNGKKSNKKDKHTVKRKGSPKDEAAKRKKSSLKSNDYNDDSDEDCDNSNENKDDSDENRDDFEETIESFDDNYENDESIIPSCSLSEKKYEGKNDTEMQQSEEKESEKPKKKGKQQRKQDKIIEEKFKEEENDKEMKMKKQQKNYEGISIIEGGVQVLELKLGTGKTVQKNNYVTIYYVARVQIGTYEPKIDECKGGLGFRFQAGARLELLGLDVGIIGMKIGGKRRLIIPHNMAFVFLLMHSKLFRISFNKIFIIFLNLFILYKCK